MEEDVKVLTIAELIHRARPLTGTSSLHSHPNRPIPRTSSSNRQRPLGSTNSNTKQKILTPLNHPAILIGTLTLKSSQYHNCFQFTDNSSEICCDVLNFNVRIIGKKIHVIAWNFIPLKSGNGFLEIIKWKFPGSSSVLSQCSSTDSYDLLPLIPGSSSSTEINNSMSGYGVHGALESISPVTVVPCSSSGSLTGSTNIRGFLIRVTVCECKLCNSKEFTVIKECHLFTKPVFVYFCGPAASCWHPVITKLVGNVITVLGLKKKLIFIGKEESQLMFVTAENSALRVPRMLKKWLPNSKTVIKGKGECGEYTGVVKGMYLQGMVVELDNNVWLLLTDKLLNVPHSVRVGAVVSVTNVHFVNPRFSWAKILILGACVKTSIIVESFSPLEVGCYINAESQSLLGKFIESLSFSARLWALLVVSCFRKKFSGILSEKEILGSKHKKGLAQMYASSHLPSSVNRARHGVFTELCKHESCGCGCEPDCGNLKLVVPISSFISHCEATWIRTLLQLDNDHHILCENNRFSFQSCESISYGRSKRRIFPNEDMGVILLGSLKISSTSGKLQLVDMTGSIEVIIPDLSSAWNANSLYEVIDYGLMMEGLPEPMDRLGLLDNESFSCRSIFTCSPLARNGNISVFVYFHVNNATSRNCPFYSLADWTNNFRELENGKFHLIRVTHKFPLLQKFQGDPLIANRSGMFVEAIVMPWDLVLSAKAGNRQTTECLRDQLNELMEHCARDSYQGPLPNKRLKTDDTSSRVVSSGLMDDVGDIESELSSCLNRESSKELKCTNLSFCHGIPCLATVRSVNNHSLVSSGILYCTKKASVNTFVDLQDLSAEKVLMEFNSENISKYQLLQIGSYYITKHHIKDSFCNIKDHDNLSGVKVLVTSKTQMWSLTFHSDEVFTNNNRQLRDPSQYDSPFSGFEDLTENQVEPHLQKVSGSCIGTCSDVHLYLSADAIDILKGNIKELEEDFIKPTVRAEENSNISSYPCATMTVSGMSSGPSDANCLFPEGNLISLRGDVVAIHPVDHTYYIHVLVDHQPVTVFGSLSEHVYLIGFGPGVNATFHRILEVGPSRLMLTPVSFVVINSIRAVNEPFSGKLSNLGFDSDTFNTTTLDTTSGLMSELIQCFDGKPMRFRCRVVAVHFLVLQKNRKYDALGLKSHSTALLVDIPLAGFVLDDGSSSCCCWANAERAATLLRLHEELPQSALENSGCAVKLVGIDKNPWRTTMYHLERILKKHDRITVRNFGSMVDSSYQDLIVSASSESALTKSDENLIKFIIFNACFGTFWTLIAGVMDTSAIIWLEKEHLLKMEMPIHSMQNIWAREVCYINPITEARNVVQELLDR